LFIFITNSKIDLLGVSDQIVADYNKMCHEIVQRNKLTHLSFDNLENYVDKSVISGGTLIEEIAKNYMPHDFDVDAAIKGDLKSTYVGFRYGNVVCVYWHLTFKLIFSVFFFFPSSPSIGLSLHWIWQDGGRQLGLMANHFQKKR
jgi:hypothetical protein